MSKENVGGAAFPTYNDTLYLGMSMRDYFAAKALPSIMVPSPTTGQYPLIENFEGCAKAAYAMADAMLKARKQ